jgi:hypothetical protein
MKELPIYKVAVAFVYSTPEGPREQSLSVLFRAKNDVDATLHGLRWARNRTASLGPEFGEVACVKVYGYSVFAPDDEGYIASGNMGCLYEWKYDRGTTFEQELDKATMVGR